MKRYRTAPLLLALSLLLCSCGQPIAPGSATAGWYSDAPSSAPVSSEPEASQAAPASPESGPASPAPPAAQIDAAIVRRDAPELSFPENGDYGSEAELAALHEFLHALDFESLTRLYVSSHSYSGEDIPLTPEQAERIFACAEAADGLSLLEEQNPPTGGATHLFIECSGGKSMLLSFNGDWVSALLPEWEEMRHFDAPAEVEAVWRQSFDGVWALTRQEPPSPAAPSSESPYPGLTEARQPKSDDIDLFRKIIASFTPEYCEAALYIPAENPTAPTLRLPRQAVSELLAMLKTTTFNMWHLTQGSQPNPHVLSKPWELRLSEDGSTLSIKTSPYFIFSGPAEDAGCMFAPDQSAKEIEALVDSLISPWPDTEAAIVPWQDISGRIDAVGQSQGGGYGSEDDLAAYRNLIASLPASDMTLIEAGLFGYEGGRKSFAIMPDARLDDLLSLLRRTEELAVYDPADIPTEPVLGGHEYARIVYSGGELLIGFNNDRAVYISAPCFDGVLSFDASALSQEWVNVMGGLYSVVSPPPEPEQKPWWYEAFAGMSMVDGVVSIFDDAAKLSWPTDNVIEAQSRHYLVENALNAAAETDGGLGESWSKTLTISSMPRSNDARILSDDKYTMQLFEKGAEVTRTNWRTEETETVRLLIPEPHLGALKQLCLERSELPKAVPLWLAMMSGTRVEKIEINDGQSVTTVRADTLPGSQDAMRSATFPVSGTVWAAVREKGSAPQGKYTVAITFNNGVVYDITVTDTELYIESSDVSAALSYRLADPETTFALLNLEHSQLINPAT